MLQADDNILYLVDLGSQDWNSCWVELREFSTDIGFFPARLSENV